MSVPGSILHYFGHFKNPGLIDWLIEWMINVACVETGGATREQYWGSRWCTFISSRRTTAACSESRRSTFDWCRSTGLYLANWRSGYVHKTSLRPVMLTRPDHSRPRPRPRPHSQGHPMLQRLAIKDEVVKFCFLVLLSLFNLKLVPYHQELPHVSIVSM